MTTLLTPPPAGPGAPPPGPAVGPPAGRAGPVPHGGAGGGRPDDRVAAQVAFRRTAIGFLASALSVLPLKTLFSDWGWLLDAWLTMAIVLVPAGLLRLRRPAGALDIWPGVILLIPWLTGRFVSAHAWLGVIPTTGTWHDVSRLMNVLHHTTRTEVAPVHTTVPIQLVLCALVGLYAALVDLVAVVGRRGALGGVPMLVVFTISGAVPRTPVPWLWFVFTAIGFLLLLALGAEEDVRTWGRRISGRGRRSSRSAISITAQRIAIVAVLAAVVLPLLVPGQSRNLIANAFHHHGTGVGGFGDGGGSGGISPFAGLKGQLVRSNPIDLATVHVDNAGTAVPFYLRLDVLSQFESDGWHLAGHGDTTPLDSVDFGSQAPTNVREAVMHARIAISGLRSNPPIFAVPLSVTGAPSATSFSAQDDLLVDADVGSGQTIDETFAQPDPTIAQLRAAPDVRTAVGDANLDLPSNLPAFVSRLVGKLTASASSPYDRARAIQRYFSPGNGFVYDLHSSVGDSGSALVDFLQGKHGFCQQYAAAMAVMLRVAGVPSRVVLGYMHDTPDGGGNFTVSTDDAHSWVEAYFAGIGWIPFDPTPASGLPLGAADALPWAPHGGGGAQAGQSGINQPHATGSGTPTTPPASSSPDAGASAGNSRSHTPGNGGISISGREVVTALVVLAVLLLLLLPAIVRMARRRRRLAAARRDGDTEALWAELSDTAVDLGYVWSPARSPRQVAQWLGRDARASNDALQSLAVAVEQRRYAGDNGAPADGRRLQDQLQQVTSELRHRRSGRTRVGAVLLPASLTRSVRWLPGRQPRGRGSRR
jgi:hypothetical protein